MADVTLVIDGDTAKAMRALAKLAQEQKKLEDGTKSLGRTSKEASSSTGRLGGALEDAAKSAVAFIGGFASLQGVVSLVEKLNDRLDSINDKGVAAARAMKPLITQLAGLPGGAGELRGIERIGAQQGLDNGQTADLANTIRSISGSDIARDMPIGARLINVGADSKAAADVVQAGILRGMGSSRAADLVVSASDQAPWTIAEAAKTIPDAAQYSSLETGLAAGVTLRTAGMPSEQIPAALRAATRVLLKDDTQLSKKFRLKGLSEGERVSRLYDAAQASGDFDKFTSSAYMQEKFGLGEEDSRAVSMMVRNAGKFRLTELGLRAGGAGQLDQRWSELMKNPEFRDEFEERVARQSFDFAQRYGPSAPEGRAFKAAKQVAGLQLEGSPVSALTTNKEGEANWLGRMFYYAGRDNVMMEGATGIQMAPQTSWGPSDHEEARRQASASMTESTAKELVGAMKDLANTAKQNKQTSADARRVDRNGGL